MRKKRWFLSLMMAMVLCVGLMSSAMAYQEKQIWSRMGGTAGETLTAGNAVCVKAADGYIYKADANDATLRPAIGIITKGGATGESVEIMVFGIMTGWTSQTIGASGYLSETPAAITQSSPAWSQQIGVAISATDYLINPNNNFTTSGITILGVLAGATPLTLEGATGNDFETEISVADPTADRTVTLADGSGTVMLSSLATNAPDAANSVTGSSNKLDFEGATANDFETSITPADPTADRTVTLADGSGTVMLSSLATNAPDAANSVTGSSNKLDFEGATANDFETSITPTDPTADRTVTLADGSGTVMLSSLATNAPDAANSVTGVSNKLEFEGATANDFETWITPADPTADRTVTLADGSGTVMLSSLATNAPDAANSVTGASNGLLFEGATADDFETSVQPEDPTVDRTITLPNYTGGLPLVIAQGNTQTSAVNTTSDVTGSSLSLAAGWLTAGKTIKYTLSGTKTGANAAMIVHLYLSDAAVMSLTAPGNTAVDWQAEFIITEHTDAAHQNIVGRLLTSAAAVVVDYAAATKDVSGAVTLKCQIQSQHGSDTVTNEYVLAEHFVK